MIILKRLTQYFCMVALLLPILSGCAAPPAVAVAARVNGKDVTRQDVAEFIKLIYFCIPGLQEIYSKQAQKETLEKESLWFLIEYKVLEQEVERLSLKLDEQELKRGFYRLREDLINYTFASEEKYLARLQELQLTEGDLKKFQRGTMLRELLYRHVNANITVEDARVFLRENPLLTEKGEAVTLDFAQLKEGALQAVKEENYAQYFRQLLRDSEIEIFMVNK